MTTSPEYRVVWKQLLRGLEEPTPMEKACPTAEEAFTLADQLAKYTSCSEVAAESRLQLTALWTRIGKERIAA